MGVERQQGGFYQRLLFEEHGGETCATAQAAKAEPDLRRARSRKRPRRSTKHEP